MPVTQIRAFHRPDRLESVWHLIRQGPHVGIVGGGTDVAIACPPEIRVLVDLAHAGLGAIDVEDDGTIAIGAMATLTDLLEHEVVRGHESGVIEEMMIHVGSPLLRNFATIGGHLVRGFLSDVVPVLLALDTSVEVYQGAPRVMSLADYYSEAVNREVHILTKVVLPPFPQPSAAAFLRFSRSSYDHALVNTACRVDLTGDDVTTARILVGIGKGVAGRVTEGEAELTGGPLGRAAIEAAAAAAGALDAGTDWIASAEYRRHLASTLVRRCLLEVAERLGGPA